MALICVASKGRNYWSIRGAFHQPVSRSISIATVKSSGMFAWGEIIFYCDTPGSQLYIVIKFLLMLDYLDILQVFRAKRKQCNLVSRIFIHTYIYIYKGIKSCNNNKNYIKYYLNLICVCGRDKAAI